MSRTIPPPAMPLGARFDPTLPLLDNARNAWEHERYLRRAQAERSACILARRVFRRDDFEFRYEVETGLTSPLFEVEDELVVYGTFRDHGAAFALVELCSQCGKEPKYRPFSSLAALGRAMDERDKDDAHVCRNCLLQNTGRGARR